MAKDYSSYQSPLTERYAAREMKELFSPQRKHSTWRRLWLALAESERELGLTQISESALEQMRTHLDDINWDVAEAREKETRHDVMAHVHAFGLQCPDAAGIIHLGATSQFVNCNTDLIQYRDGLKLVEDRLLATITALATFADDTAGVPCLGYTHFQVAQPVTVGKRATLWLQDLMMDLDNLRRFRESLPLRGVKGTTGTQASFLALFGGDHDKVKELEKRVCAKLGFARAFPVTGQTYTRKLDYMILNAVAGIGVSLHKFASDMRLLMGHGELEEPFEKGQIGSSAMAYKRNPMRSERICSLSRHLMSLAEQAGQMASQQWLERTLDDSAIRRVIIPEAFLIADIILSIAHNIMSGMVVNHATIELRLAQNLPFMATEEIIMEHSRRGGNRQEAHEVIREASQEVLTAMRETGAKNDLFERLMRTETFKGMDDFIAGLTDPRKFIGRAEEQVHEYLDEYVNPVLTEYGRGAAGEKVEV